MIFLTFSLLESVQNHSEIWNKGTDVYKNNISRRTLWNIIAEKFTKPLRLRKQVCNFYCCKIGFFSPFYVPHFLAELRQKSGNRYVMKGLGKSRNRQPDRLRIPF